MFQLPGMEFEMKTDLLTLGAVHGALVWSRS
jgi:hypothetical protein